VFELFVGGRSGVVVGLEGWVARDDRVFDVLLEIWEIALRRVLLGCGFGF
jgi:hypothetical protein